jgi:hypothetical protein
MVNKQLVFIRKHPVTADHRREISIRDLAKAGAFLCNRQPRNALEIVTPDDVTVAPNYFIIAEAPRVLQVCTARRHSA